MLLNLPRRRLASPIYGGVDVNWDHPIFHGATFIYVQHGRQVWVNGDLVSPAPIDYSEVILRGRGGNPIRLCGSITRKEIYPVPANYTLDATVIVQGMTNKSVNIVHPGQLSGYYGVWVNSAPTKSELTAGTGGGAASSSRKSCNFDATPGQTIAASMYNTMDATQWDIRVDGAPATGRTYSGTGATFNSGFSGAYFSQGWDPSASSNLETRVGLYIYMNKSLTAAELDSVSNDPYQLFRPLRIPLFFDIPKEPVKLPAQVAYPTQDVTDGLWAPSIGTNLFEVIDETLVDDGDYIYNATGSTCEIKLGAVSAPLTDEDQQLTYRLLPGLGRLSVALKCGSVTIANWGPHILTGATQEITQVLSTAQAAAITDYADLRVVFTSEV